MTCQRELKEQHQSEHLIDLANYMISMMNTKGAHPFELAKYKDTIKAKKELKKRNKQEPEMKGIDCGEYLAEFSIPFSYIPKHLFSFMIQIQWINNNTYIPYSRDGFYSTTFHGFGEHSFDTTTRWYIDLMKYIDLVCIYNSLHKEDKQ